MFISVHKGACADFGLTLQTTNLKFPVRTYVVRIVYNAHARVMEAENSFTLTIYSSEQIFIALRWCSEMIMGFHEYTYQDREYIIRAMNTKLSMLSAHACTFSW